ncbi:MAG: TonB family protein [Thermoanaerobaculia bacterium]
MTLPIEEVLEGKYEILEKIGEGGIGSVYKVRHRLLDEIRVIKVLRPQVAAKEDHQERFLHEARMAIRLKHPNIAQLHDFSISDEGTAFIVMEFIDGIALDALLKASGPPSLDLTLEMAQQSLRALAYLHSHELVHRDVSPDNLMLTTSFDGTARIKLIDLGIAKNLAEESNLTQTGVFLGKVRYCSPEQFSSAEDQTRPLDHRSDIYSFGLLLYELLTGIYPFKGETFAELAGCHLFQPPIGFDQTDPEGKVPDELREVVLRSIAKDPEDRFSTAEEFVQELLPFRDTESSIEDELNRTVERTTSAIALKNYTRPGSTQDRLNAEFGLGTTAAPKPLTEARQPEAAGARGTASAVLPTAGGPAKKWWWIAGGGAAVVLAGLGIWLGSSVLGRDSGDTAGDGSSEAQAIEIAQTERFTLPEVDPDRVALDAALPPPPTGDEEKAAPQVEPGTDAPGPSQLGPDPDPEDGRRPPLGDPQFQGRPPPHGGRPPPGSRPGELGPPPIGRTSEIYETSVGVVAPVLEMLPEPMYPDGKRPKNRLTVDVAVLVDEEGKVLTARVEAGAGFRRRFRDAAIETAKRSRFRPAVRNGVAGRMWTSLKIVFETE